jgi:hypothetical protein
MMRYAMYEAAFIHMLVVWIGMIRNFVRIMAILEMHVIACLSSRVIQQKQYDLRLNHKHVLPISSVVAVSFFNSLPLSVGKKGKKSS